ncbi:Multicopper oxidase with three cupredoxin domains (includes cell division protein FtsP and spore coat protein CotA) [Pseudomonas benzenivorans]|nr:Multicopper oxidase with three cupredoxin domains (includes cell division protein FtsP and spore coat protein CotA) [Pseudomonas benzenivorans]
MVSHHPSISSRALWITGWLALLLSLHAPAGQVGTPISDNAADSLTMSDLRTGAAPNFAPAAPLNYLHEPLPQAPVIRSNPQTRELRVELTAAYAQHSFTTLRDGQSVTEQLYLRSYNGALVGPTLVARPGDTLRVRLVNDLPPDAHVPHCDEQGECNHNFPHHFNLTNLHTHGLHVDPNGNSDNVFVRLAHGEAFDYQIKIPADHPAGTFWYHAHLHGASSVQVGSGMAGALIVEGDYDRTPRLRNADRRIVLLQEIAFDRDGRIENNDTYAPTAWTDQAAARGWHIALNGKVMPEIRLQPGEVELWRMVHAGVRKLLNLRLVPACADGPAVPLIQLAADGIPFASKRLAADRGVFLAPGYRSDVAVRAVRPGLYYLLDTESPTAAATLPASYCDRQRGNAPLLLDEQAQNILARVVVGGAPRLMGYPRNAQLARLNRPQPIADSELAAQPQYLSFDIDISRDPWVGLINGKPYDPEQPRLLKLGEAQTWYISSVFSHHPFHIHVNPFEVIERDASGNIVDRYWKDTINTPQIDPNDEAASTIEARMRYSDFAGAFVSHCHILDHEDHGMMEKVVIQP